MNYAYYTASPEKIRQDYAQWLFELVGVGGYGGGKPYKLLLNDIHKVPFVPMIEHDDNREADGMAIRELYLGKSGWAEGDEALEGPCSVLEMLIALSKRMAFELSPTEGDDSQNYVLYFWEMIRNLGLNNYTDDRYVEMDGYFDVPEIIAAFVERRIGKNGACGLFPLEHPETDQRNTEIWAQMHAYLNERYRI